MARLGNFGQLAIFELEDAKQLLIDIFQIFSIFRYFQTFFQSCFVVLLHYIGLPACSQLTNETL